MLHYSRIAELLQKKFNCIIENVYGNKTIEYICFKTPGDILCFLHIPNQYEITLDGINLKPMKLWTKPKETFEAKLVSSDPEIPIVNMIQAKNCPDGYIKFINKLKPSLISLPYKVGLLTQEFILITHCDGNYVQDKENVTEFGEIDIFIHNGIKQPRLFLVFDVETLIHNNVMLEIKRVYNKIFELITQYTDKTYQ